MADLTAKQQEILDYIVEQQSQKGYPPSVREICEAVGLRSTSTVHGYLSRLEKKAFIKIGIAIGALILLVVLAIIIMKFY